MVIVVMGCLGRQQALCQYLENDFGYLTAYLNS